MLAGVNEAYSTSTSLVTRILADALDDRRDLHEVGPGAGMIRISIFYSWIG
jgi:hypothetical protein